MENLYDNIKKEIQNNNNLRNIISILKLDLIMKPIINVIFVAFIFLLSDWDILQTFNYNTINDTQNDLMNYNIFQIYTFFNKLLLFFFIALIYFLVFLVLNVYKYFLCCYIQSSQISVNNIKKVLLYDVIFIFLFIIYFLMKIFLDLEIYYIYSMIIIIYIYQITIISQIKNDTNIIKNIKKILNIKIYNIINFLITIFIVVIIIKTSLWSSILHIQNIPLAFQQISNGFENAVLILIISVIIYLMFYIRKLIIFYNYIQQNINLKS